MSIKKIFLLLAFLNLCSMADAQRSLCDRAYVWDFVMEHTNEQNDFTEKYTNDVEAALTDFGFCNVLQRRKLVRLIEHRKNEEEIFNLEAMPKEIRDFLSKEHSAKLVVFGTIEQHTVVGNDSIEIRLSFENLKTYRIVRKLSIVLHKKFNTSSSSTRIAMLKSKMKGLFSSTSYRGQLINEITKEPLYPVKVCYGFNAEHCTQTNRDGKFYLKVSGGKDYGDDVELSLYGANQELLKSILMTQNKIQNGEKVYVSVPQLVNNFGHKRKCKHLDSSLLPTRREGKWGYINQEEKLVIDFKYDDAFCFSEGLAPVKLGDKWGYINRKGRIEIKSEFDSAEVFKEGNAIVEKATEKFSINRRGKKK